MLDQSPIDLPLRQARLRDACCIGDARCELVRASAVAAHNAPTINAASDLLSMCRAVERLTSTQACGWRGALLRSVGLGKQVGSLLPHGCCETAI